jgi:hypothetical protein
MILIWANYLDRGRMLQPAPNGRGESVGCAVLKTFISSFSSGQQFKSCTRVHSVGAFFMTSTIPTNFLELRRHSHTKLLARIYSSFFIQ